MSRRLASRVPFVVVGVAALVGLVVTPPPHADGQGDFRGRKAGGDVERRMSEMLRQIEADKARLGRAKSEIEALAERREARKEQLAERGEALYRMSRAGMLPLAGGFPALLEHVGRLQRLERLVQDDLGSLQKLQTRTEALRKEVRELEKKIARNEDRFGGLQSDKSRHERRRAVANRFEEAFERSTFESGRKERGRLGSGGLRVVDEPPMGLESDFRALEGRLDVPVTGDFRMRETDLGEGPALRFVTAAGRPVRAAAEGRVAFSEQYGEYGRLVIVDHGDEYYTVYGNLGEVSVRVGDYVGPRARIGTVGTSEGLVFEVRRRTKSLPPRPWLGF